ncbi:hypothetical protein D3C73_1454640 [compost metagenome]
MCLGPINGDNNIAEHIGQIVQLLVFFELIDDFHFRFILQRFVHGERQHVRRSVNPAIIAVQLMNRLIVHEREGDLAFGNALCLSGDLQHPIQEIDQLLPDLHFILLIAPSQL